MFSSLKIKIGMETHFSNVPKIKYGFVKLVVTPFTFYKSLDLLKYAEADSDHF